MGKRVDYSARSVITPDPNISLNEVGVPLMVAKELDSKEIVTEFNISVLHDLVQRGPHDYPGASKIRRLMGDKKKWSVTDLRYVKNRGQIKLRPGDIVYRHLMDGDWVLFNRQPSLHKMSMMAHKVKVLYEGDTFRLNISCTSPYNADFDGD
jgi:DNA-directed RNA polymerase II subunit RPB1